MDTKELTLGGGWKAKIRRPGFFTMFQWYELGESSPEREKPPVDKGSPEANPVSETEGRPKRLTATEIKFCEGVLIPDSVIEFESPDGSKRSAQSVYLPDLGMGVFSHLLSEIFGFVNEAEAAFRSEDKAA